MHWGACGRVGNAFPRPPGAKKNFAQVSVTKWDLEGEDFFVLKPKWDFEGGVGSYLWPTSCSSALHGGLPPRPPAFNCTLFHTGIRSGTALALHVAVMGSAVLSPATPLAPCCFQSTHSGLQQV